MRRLFALFCLAMLSSTGVAYAVTFVIINNNPTYWQAEHFVSSTPKDHQTVKSPDTVSVNFSSPIDSGSSHITIYDLYGTEVTDGTVTVNGATMSTKLPSPLDPGKYTAKWETCSLNSNTKLKGEFHFTVE